MRASGNLQSGIYVALKCTEVEMLVADIQSAELLCDYQLCGEGCTAWILMATSAAWQAKVLDQRYCIYLWPFNDIITF